MKTPTFQLTITMNGTSKKAIKERLLSIVKEIDSNYGKPCQGIISEYQLETHISTPIWNNQSY